MWIPNHETTSNSNTADIYYGFTLYQAWIISFNPHNKPLSQPSHKLVRSGARI